MNVTQHARYTALFHLLRQRGFGSICDRIVLHALEQDWLDHCGLRLADLNLSLDELISAGALARGVSNGTAFVELTDRGVLALNDWIGRPSLLGWLRKLARMPQLINTAQVLARARKRCENRLQQHYALQPIRDRRRMSGNF